MALKVDDPFSLQGKRVVVERWGVVVVKGVSIDGKVLYAVDPAWPPGREPVRIVIGDLLAVEETVDVDWRRV